MRRIQFFAFVRSFTGQTLIAVPGGIVTGMLVPALVRYFGHF